MGCISLEKYSASIKSKKRKSKSNFQKERIPQNRTRKFENGLKNCMLEAIIFKRRDRKRLLKV